MHLHCMIISNIHTNSRAQIYNFDREINDFYHHKERAKVHVSAYCRLTQQTKQGLVTSVC